MKRANLGSLLAAISLLLAARAHAQDSSPPAPPASPIKSRWRTTLYGFVEVDAMHDTTQSYGPASNNIMLARPGTYAAAHARSQMTVNNSLIGLRVAAPEFCC